MNEAQLFTVRVWRHAEQFRACVRAVGEEHAHLFVAPAPLVDFLLRGGKDDGRPPPAPAKNPSRAALDVGDAAARAPKPQVAGHPIP
jgi:hypothetical protein